MFRICRRLANGLFVRMFLARRRPPSLCLVAAAASAARATKAAAERRGETAAAARSCSPARDLPGGPPEECPVCLEPIDRSLNSLLMSVRCANGHAMCFRCFGSYRCRVDARTLLPCPMCRSKTVRQPDQQQLLRWLCDPRLASRVEKETADRVGLLARGGEPGQDYYDLIELEKASADPDGSFGSSVPDMTVGVGVHNSIVEVPFRTPRWAGMPKPDVLEARLEDLRWLVREIVPETSWYGREDTGMGVVVAGGLLTAAVSGLLGKHLRGNRPMDIDIDLFLCGRCLTPADGVDFIDLMCAHLSRGGYRVVTFPMNHVYNMYIYPSQAIASSGAEHPRRSRPLPFGVKVQVILRLYPTPAHVVHGFDLEPCKLLFDGERCYATPSAAHCLTTGIMLCDESKWSSSAEHRYVKYMWRYGFALLVPGMRSMAQAARMIGTPISGLIRKHCACMTEHYMTVETVQTRKARQTSAGPPYAACPNADRGEEKGEHADGGDGDDGAFQSETPLHGMADALRRASSMSDYLDMSPDDVAQTSEIVHQLRPAVSFQEWASGSRYFTGAFNPVHCRLFDRA